MLTLANTKPTTHKKVRVGHVVDQGSQNDFGPLVENDV
jgi:hypothetical protein